MAAPSTLGFNFAQDSACYNSIPECNRQDDILASLGSNKRRVLMPIYDVETLNPSFKAALEGVVQNLLNRGRYTIYGYTSNGRTITNTNYDWMDADMKLLATRMQGIGLSEISVGNEEDIRIDGTTVTQTQLMNKQIQTALDIKNAGFTGNISVTITTNVYAQWKANVANWQGHMKLGVNIYNTLSAFRSQVADMVANLPTQSFVPEFNTNNSGRTGWNTVQEWESDCYQRALILATSGLVHFAFATAVEGVDATKWTLLNTPMLNKLGRVRPTLVNV